MLVCSDASLVFRFVRLFIAPLWLWFVVICQFFYQDNKHYATMPPTSTRFCTWLYIKYFTNFTQVTFFYWNGNTAKYILFHIFFHHINGCCVLFPRYWQNAFHLILKDVFGHPLIAVLMFSDIFGVWILSLSEVLFSSVLIFTLSLQSFKIVIR